MFNLYDIGLQEAFIRQAEAFEGLPARVSAQYRDLYRVMAKSGERVATVSGAFGFRCASAADYPAVGDWVIIEGPEDALDRAVIRRVLPRNGFLSRRAPGTGQRQIIAANVDVVFVCTSLNRDFNPRRIERYLSVVWESMALPVIVLTKSDATDNLTQRLQALEAVAAGVEVVVTCGLNNDGADELRRYLKRGVTAVFVGSSGAGKSTLINRLLCRDAQHTKAIRESDGKGRHATVNRQMFLLPDGGVVIDTPGLRELQMDSADLQRTFADIDELAKRCRFKDCAHENEPGCAVKQAVRDGVLPAERLKSFKKLRLEMVFAAEKASMTETQAQKQKTIRMMGSLVAQKQARQYNPKSR